MSKRQTTFVPGNPFWVNVRQEHIENGRRFDPLRCALSLAIEDRLAGAGLVSVGTTLVSAFPLFGDVVLPTAAKEWRYDFDRGAPVKPFKFKLVIPERREANG